MKKLLALMVCGAMGLSAVACGQTEETDSTTSATETSETSETETAEAETTSTGTVDNSFAEDTDALVEAYADVFDQVEYTDDETGLTVTYNIYLPEDYDESEEYAVDTDRIYGTGQSMGCMTTLILASEYPDLYAACMFVDGQWDVSTLSSLEDQTFIYFAAEDDQNAYNGMQEVMSMFDEDGVDYTYAQWDGTWTPDELSEATSELLSGNTNAYFVSWASGTIEASSETSFSGPNSSSDDSEKPAIDADSENTEVSADTESSEAGEKPEGGKGNGNDSMMQSVQYHMASFDYAYRCVAVMEWLFEN